MGLSLVETPLVKLSSISVALLCFGNRLLYVLAIPKVKLVRPKMNWSVVISTAKLLRNVRNVSETISTQFVSKLVHCVIEFTLEKKLWSFNTLKQIQERVNLLSKPNPIST